MRYNPTFLAFLALVVEAAASPAAAQGPPSTDIFLAELDDSGATLALANPQNLTARPGYDNQPAFTADGAHILFTSIRDGQADTYRIDLTTRQVYRVTSTPESEYSPTPMPGSRNFSVVRVEADSAQRLWSFGPDGAEARLLLEGIEPVGYHAWGDPNTVAMFVLGSPPTLQVANLDSGRARTVAENVGRSLHRIPDKRAISFVHKVGPDEWWIKQLDLETGAISQIAPTLPGREDYAWTPGGVLLMASDATVYALDPRLDSGWIEAADLSGFGLGQITRIAVDPAGKRVALAAVPADPAGGAR